jgi:hypothetical protein
MTGSTPVFSIFNFITPEAKAWFSDHPQVEVPDEAANAIQAIVDAKHPFTPLDIAKLACAFQVRREFLRGQDSNKRLRALLFEARSVLRKNGLSVGLCEEIDFEITPSGSDVGGLSEKQSQPSDDQS